VLDDNYEKVRARSTRARPTAPPTEWSPRPRVPAPIGEWNFEEVTVKGSTIKVELNGSVILDTDLSKVDMEKVMGHSVHPGKDRTSGFFALRDTATRSLPQCADQEALILLDACGSG